jgi:hypothetical protein
MLSKLFTMLLQFVSVLLDYVFGFIADALNGLALILFQFFSFIYSAIVSAIYFLALLNLFVPVDLFFLLIGLWLAWRLRSFIVRLVKWAIEVIAP